jgi:thymidine kinase
MPKLYYRYGTVGSSKTLELLRVAYNYNQQGKNVILIKPKIDTRFGEAIIKTRLGISQEANIITDNTTNIKNELEKYIAINNIRKVHCILVDEVNFMSKTNVLSLRNIVDSMEIPVIAYGIKTDYTGELFEGSASMLSCADSIEEIKITCQFCNSKAIMNLKLQNGKPIKSGSKEPDLGCEEKYIPVCYKHFV